MKEILITSSVLILAVLALRRVFQKSLSRRVQYALWGLVLLRLLVPMQLPAAEFSVLSSVQTVQAAVEERMERVSFTPAETAQPPQAPAQEEAVKPEKDAASDAPASAPKAEWAWEEILPLLAGAGTVLGAAFLLAANGAFWMRLRKRRRAFPVEGYRRRVYLVEEGLRSPCLFGLFRPAVYLTPAAAASPERLRHVLAHEETHARHGDHLWALLRGVCLAAYWFDPLVWVAAAASRTDCELACDEGALARLGEGERIAYGETLLSLIPVRSAPGQMLLAATTMAAGKRQLKDRVSRIARQPRYMAAAAILAILLAAGVSACAFTGASRSEAEPEHTVTVAAVLQDWGEPVGTISLENAEPYTPPPFELAPFRDWDQQDEIYGSYSPEEGSPYSVHILTSYTDNRQHFAVADSREAYGTFKSFLSVSLGDFYGGGGLGDESLFGSEGWVCSIDYLSDTAGAVCDYFYLDGEGNPVRIAQFAGNSETSFAMDCDGDGALELVSPKELFFQRDGQVYRADIKALWNEAYPEYFLDWCRWENEGAARGMLKLTCYADDEDGIFRLCPRYLRLKDGELLVYRDPRVMEDHVMSGVRAPGVVVDKAKELVQAGMPQAGGRPVGANSDGELILDQAEYDDWRVESITGPEEIQVGGIKLCVYRYNYEYHTTTPEKIMLAGGMYITEDDWVMPGYPDCDYLFFRQEEDDSLTFLWHDWSNDTGPEDMAMDGLALLGLLDEDPVYLVQGLWEELCGMEDVTLDLRTADGAGGGAYSAAASGWGWNRPGDITSDFRWEVLGGEAPDGTQDSAALFVGTTEKSLTFYQEPRLVEYRNGDRRLWFRAEQTAEDDVFAEELFEFMRMWYDEIEHAALETGIAIPDDGRSRVEIARDWVERYEGVHLQVTSGSKSKYTYADVRDVEENTFLERDMYPADIGDREAFLFSYRLVFVPENEKAFQWSMAGNTGPYSGDEEAPEGAMEYHRYGYMYRDEDGWRCDGVGTGP